MVSYISTASGALFSTGTGTPSFGTLPVAQGGTGATTFTSGNVLIGSGTGAITTRSIDTTSGRTSASTSLITSGAVYSGFTNTLPVGIVASKNTSEYTTIGFYYGAFYGVPNYTDGSYRTGSMLVLPSGRSSGQDGIYQIFIFNTGGETQEPNIWVRQHANSSGAFSVWKKFAFV